MSEEKLRALLAETRGVIVAGFDHPPPHLIDRIDAALAEPAEIDDTVIATWTREQYERAFKQGAEAMREAAAGADAYHPEDGEPVVLWGVERLAKERDEAREHSRRLQEVIVNKESNYDLDVRKLVQQRDEARAEAKERSEFAAAETGHANRWAERAHAAEKRCKEVGDEAALAQHERDEARAEVERLKVFATRLYGAAIPGVTFATQYEDLMVENVRDGTADRERMAYQRGAEEIREAAAQAIIANPHLGVDHICARLCVRQIRALPVPEGK